VDGFCCSAFSGTLESQRKSDVERAIYFADADEIQQTVRSTVLLKSRNVLQRDARVLRVKRVLSLCMESVFFVRIQTSEFN